MWYDLAGKPKVEKSHGHTKYHYRKPVIVDNKRRDAIFRSMETILSVLPPRMKIIVMSPIPRYMNAPCCDEADHMLNWATLSKNQIGRGSACAHRFVKVCKRFNLQPRLVDYQSISGFKATDPATFDYLRAMMEPDEVHLSRRGAEKYARVIADLVVKWRNEQATGKGKADLRSKIRGRRREQESENYPSKRSKGTGDSDELKTHARVESEKTKAAGGGSNVSSEMTITGGGFTITIKPTST